MNPFYKLGARSALQRVFGDQTGSGSKEDTTAEGTPFPQKQQNIGAELLAQRLQDEEDVPERKHPDNTARKNDLDRPVTWGAPSTIDENSPSGGLMLPLNPRS
jgi:hypothetical protein